MRRRMGVGPNDHHSGADISVLRQNLVANAAVITANFVKSPDAVIRDKLANSFLVRSGLCAFRRHAMVEDDRNPLRVPHVRNEACAVENFVKLVDYQGSIFMGHRQINRWFDDVTRRD
jgi:hypothetical protein